MCAFYASALAEVSQTAPPDILLPAPPRTIDMSLGGQQLNGGNGNWRSLVLRGTYGAGPHLLQAELAARREFGVRGQFAGIGDAVTLDPDWVAGLSAGAGDGAFFLPRYRVDGFVSRRLLLDKTLVVTVGTGYYAAPDGHRDSNVNLSAAWYLARPLVLEAGVRFNRSNPGSVNAHQQFVAATAGQDHENLVSGRVAWGSEGYLPLGPSTSLVGFNSTELTLSWRHWLSKRMGLLSAMSHYRNPSYERTGIDVGAFIEFD